MPDLKVPTIRIDLLRDEPPNPKGQYVLYWMIAHRRLSYNFALERACWWAQELSLPLIILEPLRCDYTWASDRLHRFVLDGMDDHARALQDTAITYYPYVEPSKGAGRGLLEALASRASVVITDEYPAFFLPRMVKAAATKLKTRMEQVDANGLLPLRATDRVYTTAYSFRRGLHKLLPKHIDQRPSPDPIAQATLKPLPANTLEDVLKRWPKASEALLKKGASLDALPIDHSVAPAPLVGGDEAAAAKLERFMQSGLSKYKDERNDPDAEAASGLSPYLHFGHIGAHHIFDAIITREQWQSEQLATKPTGQREGWWNMSEVAEAFLDELITWREIGYNMAYHDPEGLERYESLADWAKQTLKEHEGDERPYLYTPEQLEQAQTHDKIWNAAQNELVTTGKMHNYLRMLWGKKIIEWSPTPQDALEVMIELNNKYALDGRDPNSYSGIMWCFGRYDRGWTEREVLGKVRYMSSDSTRRKLKLKQYLKTYAS